MGMECKFGPIKHDTKGNGSRIVLTVRVSFTMLMVISSMDSGKTIRLKDTVFISMPMGMFIKVTGIMISNTDLVSKCGSMDPSMKVSIMKEENKEEESTHGQMAVISMESGTII